MCLIVLCVWLFLLCVFNCFCFASLVISIWLMFEGLLVFQRHKNFFVALYCGQMYILVLINFNVIENCIQWVISIVNIYFVISMVIAHIQTLFVVSYLC